MVPKTFCKNAIQFACTLLLSVFILNVNADNKLVLNETEPTMHINFDACVSFFGGSNTDFSEFTAVSTVNASCSEIELVGGHVYRDNPQSNPHSCAPGFENISMCIDGLDNCDYIPGDDKSLKFDIRVIPGPSGFGALKEISFYEQAPENFTFIEGASGVNNYPTLMGIRVLVDGTEIYSQFDIPTSRTWTQRTIDFSIISDFTVSDTTVFNIEILPYCLVGNGAPVRAWDIDELTITAGCNDVNGGLAVINESATVCSSDSTSSIRTFDVTLESGPFFSWVLVDNDGIIMDTFTDGIVDFEQFDNGLFNVYHIAYEANLEGLVIGENISDLEGCYDLSNAITVNNSKVQGGVFAILGDEMAHTICSNDSIDNVIESSLTDAIGMNVTYLIVDDSGSVVSIQQDSNLDFRNISDGIYTVTAYSHNGVLDVTLNMDVESIDGCFSVSNSITVTKSLVEGGTISFNGQDTIMACASNTFMVDPDLIGAFGENMSWVISSNSGFILAISDTLPIDISVMNFSSIDVRHISYLNGTTGLTLGGRITDILGCFDMSNVLQVMLPQVNGGDITVNGQTEFSICTNQSGNQFDVDIENAEGNGSTVIVTDTLGVILDLAPATTVDFDNAGPGICVIWNISFESTISGLEVGANVADIEGCYDLSNGITVERISIEGGDLANNLDQDVISICSGDGIDDEIVFETSNTQGIFSSLVVTDENGLILEIPDSDTINFEGVPQGICLVYNVVYLDTTTEISAGINVDSLQGCYDLSNAITINREEVNGGDLTLIDGTTMIDVIIGDGMDEMLEVNLENTIGDSTAWIITDSLGMILSLPSSPPFNFEAAGEGVCLIWNLSYNDTVTGLEVGANVNDIIGCSELSNPITVTRTVLSGGTLSLPGGGTAISVCVGDAIIDSIEVSLVDNEGPNSAWIITDDAGLILELPMSPPFVFENAPSGICQIWHVSYANTLVGLTVGENISGLSGTFNLSNTIDVTRMQVNGGQIEGPGGLDTFNICSGDGIDDLLPVIINDSIGEFNQWVITDENSNIIDLPMSPPFNFENAPTGTCFIYNVAYQDGLTGLEIDSSLNNLMGCYDLSNAITVIRDFVAGGILSTESGQDTINIIVGEGVIDSIDVSLIDAVGDSSHWVITDSLGVILDLPASPPFVFEGAGAGTCIVYHVSANDSIENLALGENIINLIGCYDFSNAITVVRTEVNGGIIQTLDDTTFVSLCIIEQGESLVDVNLSDNEGDTFAWIITDESGEILSLPTMPPFDFATVPSGLCRIWHLASIGAVTGLTVGEDISGISGIFDLSNSIDVLRSSVDGGILMTTNNQDTVMIIANDGISDAFDVILNGTIGDSLTWVITDEAGEILGLPMAPPFDLDNAGAGTCQIWNVSSNDTIGGLNIGGNISNLTGCYDFSNPITVIREAIDGGNLMTIDSLTEVTVCLSDTISDMIDVILTDTSGVNSAWIITDTNGLILNLPPAPPFDFSAAGIGICEIWHISYDTGLMGLEVDSTLSSLNGSFDLSNQITVNRDSISGGDIELPNGMTSDTITVGDGIIDSIEVNMSNAIGSNMTWVITDTFGVILELPTAPPFIFENAGGGVCQIWHLSYSDGLTGLTVDENINDLMGCFDFSNAVTIVRQGLMGGILTTDTGMTDISVCVGDGVSDAIDVILTDTLGPVYSWVITDTSGVIVGLPMAPPFEFDDAGVGICQIWNLTHDSALMGLVMGENIDTLVGNHDFSNPINVNRAQSDGGTLMTSDSLTEITINVGEGITDTINVILSDTLGDNHAWVITDDFGVILELPSSPPFFFESAGGGVCQIYSLSYADGLMGLAIGENINNLVGCHDLSNSIEVNRIPTILNGGVITTDEFLTTVNLCVGDGMPTPIPILISGNEGPNEQWVVTDTLGLILGLPTSQPIDLELAGPGVSQIWNLAYSNGLQGLTIGENVADFVGFYDFSNAITVIRTSVDGGELEYTDGSTEVTIMVGDGIIDSLEVNLTGTEGDTMVWVITDDSGNIMELPDGPPFTFENAGVGVCQIWNLSHATGLTGLVVGNNISQLDGCHAFSNPLTVNREGLSGGVLTDLDGNTTTQICLSTGLIDLLEVMLTDTSGANHQYILTDDMGEIIDLPSSQPFNLSTSSAGQCVLYNIAYDTEPGNLVVGDTISNLTGLFDLSNALIINKDVVEGGTITYDDGTLIDTINVDDGIIDSIFLDLTLALGDTMQWVVTDTLGNILDLPEGEPLTFEDFNGGTCRIWNLSYLLGLQGLSVGNNVNQLEGCFEFSNFVTLFKEGLSGGIIAFEDGSTLVEICQGDGVSDFLDVTVSGAQGLTQDKFFTLTSGQIILTGSNNFPFNFESIPATNFDTLLIYNISYDVEPDGYEISSFINSITGEFALSNAATVVRNIIRSGIIEDNDGLFASTIIVGDGIPDTLNLNLMNEFGDSLTWVVVEDDTIRSFANNGEFIYPESDPLGVQSIYHASLIDGEVTGFEIGMPIDSVEGCIQISNEYVLTRKELNGGMLTTTAGDTLVNLCVGDDINDFVNVIRTGELGSQFTLIVTNTNGIIDSIASSSQITFENSGESHIYNVSHDATITGLVPGNNISGLGGCFELSNRVRVISESVFASNIFYTDGVMDPASVCVGDGVDDEVSWSTSFATPNFIYLLTDTFDVIDTVLTMTMIDGSITYNFEDTPVGECRIYGLSYVGDLLAEKGDTVNVSTLSSSCWLISNFLTMVKEDCPSGEPFSFELYPNPTVDVLTLDLVKRPYDESEIYIYSSEGKMVKTQSVEVSENTIDITNFNPGIYYMKIASKGKSEMRKFIILE